MISIISFYQIRFYFGGMLKLLLVLLCCVTFISCNKKGCTDVLATNYNESAKKDDGSCIYVKKSNLKIFFDYSFDGVDLTNTNLNNLQYTVMHGEKISFTRLVYLISDFCLYTNQNDSINFNGYHLVDLSKPNTLVYSVANYFDTLTYSALSFKLGFASDKNISGIYSDLNYANWNWPQNLGGGYHQMQFEGKFISTLSDTLNYALHSGSSVREITSTDTIYHNNHNFYKLNFSPIKFGNEMNIRIKMKIDEWFKNPNEWDLNVLNNGLMGNYNAQQMLHQNAFNIFELVQITE